VNSGHRAIGKDGKLVGYGGGLWRKQDLLDLEHDHTAGQDGEGATRHGISRSKI
jgi:hypothetical protein